MSQSTAHLAGQASLAPLHRYLDGTLKALNPTLGKRDPNSIISQQWVPNDGTDSRERLLAGTTDGEVLVMEVGEFFGFLRSDF